MKQFTTYQKNGTNRMNTARKIQLTFIVILWLALCYLMVTSQPFSLRVAFIMVASGIVVFVPIYKKYMKK